MENKDQRLYKNRWILLIVIILAPFMSTLDSSIVNVALPKMTTYFKVTMASIEWVVTSYLIVISSLILLFGRLGDIKGKSYIFKWGFAIFTIGSLMCGLSPNFHFLILARCIQAIGAAGTMANSQGIITHMFPQNERGKALGFSGTAVALGTMAGPPLGGFIVQFFNWHYIFLINVPIGAIAIFVSIKLLPKRSTKQENIDFLGTILFAGTIVSLFYGIIDGQKSGYTNTLILSCFAVAIILFILFMLLERKLKNPLLDLTIFRNGLFSLSIFTGFLTFLAISSTNIIQPFYLQNVLSLNPARTGLIMMVYPIILFVVSPVSGDISDKIGSEVLTFIGLIISALSLFLMSTLKADTSIIVLIIYIALMSFGNGLFQSPNNSLIMSTVSKDKLGIAGSVNGFVRNLGLVAGISASTTILYSTMSAKLGYRVTGYVKGRSDVFVHGMHYAYLAAAGFCVIGCVLTALRLSRRNKVTNMN